MNSEFEDRSNLTTKLIAARMGLQFSWIEANFLGFFLAARSDHDRGFFHVLSAPSNSASGERMATIARSHGPIFRGASAI